MNEPVLRSVDFRGVATVTLNRPEVNNAYDGALVQGLHDAMDELAARTALRAVVLRGAGRHFQAGADLKWIMQVKSQSVEENERASRATALAVHRLNTLPVPTLALVQGACFGGGYALSGERFGAQEARRIGLVHEVVPAAELQAAGERMVDQLLQNAPEANAQDQGGRARVRVGRD